MVEREIIKRCMNATRLLAKYDESLPDYGIAEALIFNVYVALNQETKQELVENTLIHLIRFLGTYDDNRFEINNVAKHVTERMVYYDEIWKTIVDDHVHFDLKPLYCAFYRYPFTDIHYAVANPKDPNSFRKIVLNMVDKSLKRSRLICIYFAIKNFFEKVTIIDIKSK